MKAHKEAGLKPGPWLQADWLAGSESGQKSVSRKFLARVEGLSALFCVTDRLAMHVLGLVRTAGNGVPDDLAIVGYDDIEYAAAAAVPLTSVRQPRQELGRRAAELVLDEADNPAHRHQQLVFTPELVARRSTMG